MTACRYGELLLLADNQSFDQPLDIYALRWVGLNNVQGFVPLEQTKTQAGKYDWAVFLSTDTALTAAAILELYAMR